MCVCVCVGECVCVGVCVSGGTFNSTLVGLNLPSSPPPLPTPPIATQVPNAEKKKYTSLVMVKAVENSCRNEALRNLFWHLSFFCHVQSIRKFILVIHGPFLNIFPTRDFKIYKNKLFFRQSERPLGVLPRRWTLRMYVRRGGWFMIMKLMK